MRPQDDTMLKEQNVTNETGNKGTDKTKAKAIAATAAVLGTGAAYVLSTDNDDAMPEELAATEPVEARHEEPVTANEERPTESKTEESQDGRKEESPVAQNHQREEEGHTTDNHDDHNGHNINDDRLSDVSIESIDTRTTENGETHHVATGTVNGHEAAFVDDGHGNVQTAVVDLNDNGNVDDGEVIDMRASNVTMGDLAQHLSTDEEIVIGTPNPENPEEVKVIAVDNNVDLNGQTVDVASVTINDNPVILVDANQDGEVNAMLIDVNNNGQLDEGEVHDVTENHIPMPTQDDIENPTLTCNDDIPDYSNDADISSYDA